MQLQLTLRHIFSHYELVLCEPIAPSLDWRDQSVATPCEDIKTKIQRLEKVFESGLLFAL
jgi:hypothetical protein